MALNNHMTKIIKLVEEKQMCSLPWVHVEVNLQEDSVRPCCKYIGNTGKVSDGFTNTWMNEENKNLRQNWIDGVPVSKCSPCAVNKESFSYKKWKNEKYSQKFDFLNVIDVEQPITPSVFNFTLSNTCNLGCRMCDPRNSSVLAQISRRNPNIQKYLGLLPEQKKSVDVEALIGSFENTEFIIFGGGEPLIDEDTIKVIKLIKSESSKLKLVNFSTNLTVINDDLLYELNGIQADVLLSISIDGPERIHEYIRHRCSWNIMTNNISYIKEKYPNIKFSVNTTLSALNIGYVTETLKTLYDLQQKHDISFKSLLVSPVLNKKYLHPGVLPEKVKKLYLDKIKSDQSIYSFPDSHSLLPTAIELLSKDYEGDRAAFIDYINQFDVIANTSVTETYPEFKSFWK